MRIGIDASNLRGGGGLTHLIELLEHADPSRHGFSELHVWSGKKTAKELPKDKQGVLVHTPAELDGTLLSRIYWVQRCLPKLASDCDLLFAPGGLVAKMRIPTVTMSRNMLPFELKERQRFAWGWQRFRLELLARQQSVSFNRATGLIFLSQYAFETVSKVAGLNRDDAVIIHHGVNEKFRRSADDYQVRDTYTMANPFRFLYVSTVNRYKHHGNVVKAVTNLRQAGLPVVLDMYGGGESKALSVLSTIMKMNDPRGEFLRYHGGKRYSELPAIYHKADAFVYASSCENLPNILLEAMASALPICCSGYGPMPEILGNSGVYFDPESIAEIEQSMATMVRSPAARRTFSLGASKRAEEFNWESCVDQTFSFLREVREISLRV